MDSAKPVAYHALVSMQPGAIYEEGSETYMRGVIPLALVTALIAIPVNLLLFVDPGPLFIELAWTIVVAFFGTTMLATAALVPMIDELRTAGATRVSTGFAGLRASGGRVLFATAPLVLLNGFLVLTWIGTVVAIFVAVRFALFPLAVANEDADATDAVARSWELIAGAWWRTAGILFGALTPYALFMLVVSAINLSRVVGLLFTVIAQAMVVPFVVIVLLLVFKDYRSAAADEPARPAPRFPSGPSR